MGIAISSVKDSYGKYFQINLIVANTSDSQIIFNPCIITAYFIKSETEVTELNVYTNEEYQQMIEKKQKRDMIIETLNSLSAGYSTVYVNGRAYTIYDSNAAALASDRIRNFKAQMTYEKDIRQIGYLKKNTVYPSEIISGYMNIKNNEYNNGILNINIPVGNDIFLFQYKVEQKE